MQKGDTIYEMFTDVYVSDIQMKCRFRNDIFIGFKSNKKIKNSMIYVVLCLLLYRKLIKSLCKIKIYKSNKKKKKSATENGLLMLNFQKVLATYIYFSYLLFIER